MGTAVLEPEKRGAETEESTQGLPYTRVQRENKETFQNEGGKAGQANKTKAADLI